MQGAEACFVKGWTELLPRETSLQPFVSATCGSWAIIGELGINRHRGGVNGCCAPAEMKPPGVHVAIFITLYQTMMKTAYCPFKAATPPQLSENAFHHGLRFQITGSWSQQKHNICNPSSAKPDMLRPLAVPRDLSLKITISMKTKGSLGRVQRPLSTYLT